MHASRHLLLVLIASAPLTARADGLVYRLPKDGSKVTYQYKAVHTGNGRERKLEGELSIASVGKDKVDGADCRWIEIAMTMRSDGRDRKVVAKMLIPESDIGKGKLPAANVKRGWVRMRADGKPEPFRDPSSRHGGPIPAFLAGPLQDVKESKAVEFKTGIGKLKCRRLTGKTSYEQGSANRTDRFDVEYDLRLHEKSPFGVAGGKLTITEFRNKTQRDDVIAMDFTLKSVSTKAKSELPDSK